MPSKNSVDDYKRFMETGICDCGNHVSDHVRHLDDLRRRDTINCKLTQDTIVAWHTPRADMG